MTSNGMRLLVCTQAVDSDDSDLGFFVRWIEEFAKHCEHVIVICLRKGAQALPKNVEVISLGERNKFLRALEVCTISFGRRTEYNAVFVHMNPEYVVAAGWLWRLMHKKIGLWYVHKSVNTLLRIAAAFATVIFSASKESFRLPSRKLHIVGHGIDTDFFTQGTSPRDTYLLSAGRLSKSKNHELAIKAAHLARRKLRIAGEGPERETLEKLTEELEADVEFLGGLTNGRMRTEYQSAAYFIHTSETGSLDKVVLEALACGCPVVTTSTVYAGFPVECVAATPEAIAKAVAVPAEVNRVPIIREKHSLVALIPRILQEL